MTKTKSRRVQVQVTSRRLSVHFAGLRAEGMVALAIIAIISIVKIAVLACVVIWKLTALVMPPLTRLALRYAAGVYLGFRAFYTE